MTNEKIKYWIKDWYKSEPSKTNINIKWAQEFLLKSRDIHLNIESNSASRARLVEDLYRSGMENEAEPLLKDISEKDQFTFELHKLKGIVSIKPINELLELIPYSFDYGNVIIGERLINEGFEDSFLRKLPFDELDYNSKLDITELISLETDNILLVTTLFNKCRNDNKYIQSESNPISRFLGRLIKHKKIDLTESLEILKNTNQLRDSIIGILADSFARIGDINSYSEALNLIENKSRITWNVLHICKVHYLKMKEYEQQDFLKILKSIKHSKETNVHFNLFTKYLTPKLKINKNLFDFYQKHKRKQIDDLINDFLILNHRYKESIFFTDEAQGHNRFSHYERALISLLNQNEFDFVVQKAKEIKSNDLRNQIIGKLCDLNEIELAKKARKELLKTKQMKMMSESKFIEYYARNNEKSILIEHISKNDEHSQSHLYHKLGRYFLGLDYNKFI